MTSVKEYNRRLYRTCREQGLCSQCRQKVARPGKATCQTCLDAFLLYERNRRARFKEENLCSKCGKAEVVNGRRRCSSCLKKIRKHILLREYGLTQEGFYKLLASQKGRCAICKTRNPKGKGTWHVDHDHETREVRGLLCHNCNTGLGRFEDSPETLEAAVKYLKRARKEYHGQMGYSKAGT